MLSDMTLDPEVSHRQSLVQAYERAIAQGMAYDVEDGDFVEIAYWYITHQQPEKAMLVMDYALKLRPDNVDLLIQKSYMCFEQDDIEGAWQACRCIKEINDEVRVLQFTLLMTEGKIDQAETVLEMLENPDNIEQIIDVASTYSRLGHPDKALAIYEAHKETGIHHETFAFEYIHTLGETGHEKQAIELLEKLIDQSPYQAEYWTELAQLQYHAGRIDKAIEAIDFSITAEPGNPFYYLSRATFYNDLGNYEKALDDIKQAQELGIDDADTLQMLDEFRELLLMQLGEDTSILN